MHGWGYNPMGPLTYDIDGEQMTVEAMTAELGRLSVTAFGWDGRWLPMRQRDLRRLTEIANALAMAATAYEFYGVTPPLHSAPVNTRHGGTMYYGLAFLAGAALPSLLWFMQQRRLSRVLRKMEKQRRG